MVEIGMVRSEADQLQIDDLEITWMLFEMENEK